MTATRFGDVVFQTEPSTTIIFLSSAERSWIGLSKKVYIGEKNIIVYKFGTQIPLKEYSKVIQVKQGLTNPGSELLTYEQ